MGRIISGSEQHPATEDVLRAVLARLLDEAVDDSWAHFELIAEGGWLKRMLARGLQPWVEVAFVDSSSMDLNLGQSRVERAGLPSHWALVGDQIWRVPVTDFELLIDWASNALTDPTSNPDRRVVGWLEGV